MDGSLKNKVALVTGSTTGIGRGIAHCLASKGCSIVLTGIATQEEIEKLVQEFQSQYKDRTFHYIPGDLLYVDKTQQFCEDVLAVYPQGVDILVNNAGWGRIINMSSQLGLIAMQGRISYCTTKSGLLGFSRVAALEGAQHGVTCNAICPSYIDGGMLYGYLTAQAVEKGVSFEECKKEFAATNSPSGKLIPVSEVAELVAFLCSDAASSITGSPIPIDCGNMIR